MAQADNLKYQQHVFFCTNDHEGKTCCSGRGSLKKWRYAKDKIKSLGLHGENQIRINKSGCFGFCESGPLIVIYPDAVWYRYVDQDDIDEILQKHVLGGQIVTRLLFKK